MTEIDDLIEMYRDLEERKKQQTIAKMKDTLLIEWNQELQKLDKLAHKLILDIGARSDYFGIEQIEIQKYDLKEQIKAVWEDPAKKTHKSPFGIVTLRTTRSLIIDSVKTVAEVLVKNNKTEECIATFKLTEIGKLANAGLLDDAVHYDEKHSVSVKLTEDK